MQVIVERDREAARADAAEAALRRAEEHHRRELRARAREYALAQAALQDMARRWQELDARAVRTQRASRHSSPQRLAPA